MQLQAEAAKHGVTVGIRGSLASGSPSCAAYPVAYLAWRDSHRAKEPSRSQSRSSSGPHPRTCCFDGTVQAVDDVLGSFAGVASRVGSSRPGLHVREGRTGCCVVAGWVRKGCLGTGIRTAHAGTWKPRPAPGMGRQNPDSGPLMGGRHRHG